LFIQIGQGTYSNVYRAHDLERDKIVALKKVRFDNLEPESVKFMAREILILRRLDHPNVIKLEGIVTSRMSCSLYLVFEYMEHDLAGLASFSGAKFTESQVCTMLCGGSIVYPLVTIASTFLSYYAAINILLSLK
jgi:serine/threonine protein kinase